MSRAQLRLPAAHAAALRSPPLPFRAGRLVALAAAMFLTNAAGFLDLPGLIGMPGLFAPSDVATVLVVGFGVLAVASGDRVLPRVLRRGRMARPVLVMLALVFATMLSMPLRGDVAVLEAVRLARWFFPLLLFFVVARDVRGARDARAHERIVYALALLYTFGVLVYTVAPEVGRFLYSGAALATYTDAWGLGADRHVLKGNNGILFIHLGCILAVQRLVRGGSWRTIAIVAATSMGIMLQGWRAVMLGALLGILVTTAGVRARIIGRMAAVGAVLATLAVFVDVFVVRGIVRAKFSSAIFSLSTGEGSIGARWARDQVYMLPMFMERPWLGWGFIHKNSGMAAEIGLMDSNVNKTYTIYNFDSGYLTLLNMFGIVGVTIFMGALATLLYRARRSHHEVRLRRPDLAPHLDQWSATVVAFGLMLIVSQHTFGGLMTPIGLLPLAWVAGVCQGLRLSADDPASRPAAARRAAVLRT